MNRKLVVPLVLVLGAIGASAAIQVGRGLGPTGKATGAPAGCAGAEEALPVQPDNVFVAEGMSWDGGEARLSAEELWESEIVPTRYVVRLRQDAAPRLAEGRLSTGLVGLDRELEAIARVPERLDDDEAWSFESDLDWVEVTERLSEFDEVLWVEPVLRFAAAAPNDPLYAFQGHLDVFGSGDATPTTGASPVVVAVVDTGVSSGVDGIGTLLPGYDFVNGDTDASDDQGHGTHVAGTIGAATDNGVGVAGVAKGVHILPVKVLAADGTGDSVAVAAGIKWAVDNGADVINLSLAGASPSNLIAEATDYAIANDVLVVASSGNDGNASGVSYPAANAGVIAVGAVGLDFIVTDYSNGGPELDVVAPGGDFDDDVDADGYPDGVLQETLYQGGFSYLFFQGTSMSAPHVSGMAALLIADGITGVDDLTAAIVETADDLGASGFDDATGYGFADLEAALAWEPAADPVGAFALSNVRYEVFPHNPRRVALLWTTDVKASSCLSFLSFDACRTLAPVERKSHRWVGALPACGERTFTVYSVDGEGNRAEAQVTVPGEPCE